ncbi:MAG: efflux RND transporter periplasmic adaptor subunit [Candidatus Aureabacteria bacterium]|nr:efflux RND transporter periplasmic adaptor subunit [Candidatus Auribacterota bacterium]
MKKHTWKYLMLLIFIPALVITFIKYRGNSIHAEESTVQVVRPVLGDIKTSISTTAVVQPQNRLEIKPSLNGRMEEILIKEGDAVTKGQTLAWMSSTERATLLDYARSKGNNEYDYWKEVYKPTPLIAPIEGIVIVRDVEEGQTVTTNDPVMVIADHLIVKAQVDETDIGKVKKGQEAVIRLDAYPDTQVAGTVDHIAYEADTVNNVTIYEVDILPETVPEIFRSGMSASVEITELSRHNVLLIPMEAVEQKDGNSFVFVQGNDQGRPILRKIQTGITDEKHIEVISGLDQDEKILIITDAPSSMKDQDIKTNPFMPPMRRLKK